MTFAVRLVQSLVLVGALCGLADMPARAQEWPTKPVTLIVPFAPGGTTDIVGRILAQQMTARLGQTVVVENVGGAGGTLGAANASRATPDGYTLFMATVAHTMAPGIYKKLAYNFETDFDPITIVAELIAYLKSKPGQISYGSAGIGSTEHMSAELFRTMTGTDIVHIPYRGGSPMLADLIAGNIQMSIETSGAATPLVQAGTVRALAVSSAKRSPLLPDLPTLDESGLKGYEVLTWYGLLVPKGTPEPIRAKLYATVADILKQPDVIKRLNEFGGEPGGMPPAQFAAFIHAETEKWIALARKVGISAEQ
jgi:tripartite-type tricarboxylate transporter receptor subunit TctC